MGSSNGVKMIQSNENIQQLLSDYFSGDELAPDVFMKYVLRDDKNLTLKSIEITL